MSKFDPAKSTGIRRLKQRPAGWRCLSKVVRKTDKGVQAVYYSWLIWVPRKAVRKVVRGPYVVPYWALMAGKKHPTAQRIYE